MVFFQKNNQRPLFFLFVIYGVIVTSNPAATLSDVILNIMVPQALAAPGDGKIYFIHNNHLGTPKAMTNEQGTVVWNAKHKPFGKATVNTDVDGDNEHVELNVRLPGQYYDKETGLHYNYHRYYNPNTGRYLTSDPIGLNGGLNTYGYVGGNPVNYSDPLGLHSGHPGDFLPPGISWSNVNSEAKTAKKAAIEAAEIASAVAVGVAATKGVPTAARATAQNWRELCKAGFIAGSLCGGDPSNKSTKPDESVIKDMARLRKIKNDSQGQNQTEPLMCPRE